MEYEDQGIGNLQANANGEFIVPSLRNVALTAPYMHDGRFQTLEEVVEHYSSQIKPHPQLHEFLKYPNGEVQQGNFTEYEKRALVAFLNTLTDQLLITDERFSDPFSE